MNTPLWQLKKQMCDIGHRIWMRGFCAGNEGNHSIRIGEDRVICTPTGISKGFLEPDDLCIVDMEGVQVEPNPKGRKRTSEALVHLAIMKKEPAIQAVIHSHPPHAVAFCLANIPLPEGFHPEAEVFLGKTISAKYATPGSPDLPQTFIDRIDAETTTVLMANHGSVSLGGTIFEAYYRLEILDNYCKQLLLAQQLGQINQLSQNEMVDLLTVKKQFGMNDPRLACAAEGCVGENNEPFLASFGVQPMSAHCDCEGDVNPTATASASLSDPALEQLVQTITDQVMAGLK